MQPRWCQATPQMMQRHTGSPWQQGDQVRVKRKPAPVAEKLQAPKSERREQALKEAGLRK